MRRVTKNQPSTAVLNSQPIKPAPDMRSRFYSTVHVIDSSNPKRAKNVIRYRENIIMPGVRIDASDRSYYADDHGTLHRAHRDASGNVSIASKRTKIKFPKPAQLRAQYRIEAKINAREQKKDARNTIERLSE